MTSRSVVQHSHKECLLRAGFLAKKIIHVAHLGGPGVCWQGNPARLSSSAAGKLQALWICTEGGLRKALSGAEGKAKL